MLAAHDQLPAVLVADTSESPRRQRRLCKTVQFAGYYGAATRHSILVTAVIHKQHTRIAHQGDIALDGIHQSAAVAHLHVQTRVHAWSSQIVVEQEQSMPA